MTSHCQDSTAHRPRARQHGSSRERAAKGGASTPSQSLICTIAVSLFDLSDACLPLFSGKNIAPSASDTYHVVPLGTALYHATVHRFDKFLEGKTWFSLDPLEGWKMKMAHAASAGAPDEERDVYLRRILAKRQLQLFLMKRTETLSKAALASPISSIPPPARIWPAAITLPRHVLHRTMSDQAMRGTVRLPREREAPTPSASSTTSARECNRQEWITTGGGEAHNVAATSCLQAHFPSLRLSESSSLIALLPVRPSVYRNPWDQDEIMLCPVVDAPAGLGVAHVGTSLDSKVGAPSTRRTKELEEGRR